MYKYYSIYKTTLFKRFFILAICFLPIWGLLISATLNKNELDVLDKAAETSMFLPPNIESFDIGALVIPMDNNYQNLGSVSDFNLKAYGLITRLLYANIPLKWAIKSGKVKDGIDFTALTRQVAPTTSSTTIPRFQGRPFYRIPRF